MLEGLPIMLALCFMLWHAYYAQNYAGIIDAGLFLSKMFSIISIKARIATAALIIYNQALDNCAWKFPSEGGGSE